MDKLDNLIKAAEKRGSFERTERALKAAGREIAHSTAQMDESGTIAEMEKLGSVNKTVSDMFR